MSIPAERKQTFLLMLMMERKIWKYEKRPHMAYCGRKLKSLRTIKICLLLFRRLMGNIKLVQLLYHNGVTAVTAAHALGLLEI